METAFLIKIAASVVLVIGFVVTSPLVTRFLLDVIFDNDRRRVESENSEVLQDAPGDRGSLTEE